LLLLFLSADCFLLFLHFIAAHLFLHFNVATSHKRAHYKAAPVRAGARGRGRGKGADWNKEGTGTIRCTDRKCLPTWKRCTVLGQNV